jgi:hypothetical protein
MILAQSYNDYRFMNANQKAQQMDLNAFKIVVVHGLINLLVVSGIEAGYSGILENELRWIPPGPY